MTPPWLPPDQFLATLPRFVLGTVVLVPDMHGRILLMHDAPSPERDLAGYKPRWLPAGGHLDHGEAAGAAAGRELLEETGLRLTLMFLGIVSYAPTGSRPATVDHWFITNRISPKTAASIRLSHEHDEYRFVAPDELSTLATAQQARLITRFLTQFNECAPATAHLESPL